MPEQSVYTQREEATNNVVSTRLEYNNADLAVYEQEELKGGSFTEDCRLFLIQDRTHKAYMNALDHYEVVFGYSYYSWNH